MIRIKNTLGVARLPSAYQEVQYIESTGTQYINTGVVNSSTIYIEHIASFANVNASVLSGSEYSSSYRFKWGLNGTNTLYIGYGSNNRNTTVSNISIDNYFTFKIGKGIQEIVGVCSYADTEALGRYSTQPIHLMARREYGGNSKTDCMGNQRTKSCKIYDNNVLIRDFVPCYRKSDNVPGLYDTVNNVFYTNAGSGTFLMGNEVSKRDININPAIFNLKSPRGYIQDKLFYGEAPKKGRFVCVGDSGKSYYSEDGETWASTNGLSGGYAHYGVVYGNGRFVAVGYNANSFYSLDGMNWTAMSGTTGYPQAVTYGNDRFVYVGESGVSRYSKDGVSWTSMSGLNSSYPYNAVCYGNGRFVCVGASGKSYYSTNGISWTAMSGLSSSYKFNAVAYGNGMFVCGGNEGGRVYYSTNGTSWTYAKQIKSSGQILCMAYGNGKFVCVFEYGYTYYSTDGKNWTSGQDISTCRGITYANDRFVAVGNSGKSYYSLDGINWVEMTGLASATYRAVCYGEI